MRRLDPAEIPSAPDLTFESSLWASGKTHIAGLDEAGRGAWAGPVAAAAVILPPDPEILHRLKGVRDSKQMTPAQRDRWAEIIRVEALAWGVGLAASEEIDALGIVAATRLAMQRALQALNTTPEHLLIDALRLPAIPCPQTAILKGDVRSLSIAAASVLAKTSRDALMYQLDACFPGYGFAVHKGYGTLAHRQALARLGVSSQHRLTFAPCRLACTETPPLPLNPDQGASYV